MLDKLPYAAGLFLILMCGPSHAQGFLEKWDLDGDSVPDKIAFDYSGGAHCCYTIKVTLSSDGNEYRFPNYPMDGGYVCGPDGSRPEHFNIGNYDDDVLPEIFMETGTYNGEHYPEYSLVLIEYAHKRLIARSYVKK